MIKYDIGKYIKDYSHPLGVSCSRRCLYLILSTFIYVIFFHFCFVVFWEFRDVGQGPALALLIVLQTDLSRNHWSSRCRPICQDWAYRRFVYPQSLGERGRLSVQTLSILFVCSGFDFDSSQFLLWHRACDHRRLETDRKDEIFESKSPTVFHLFITPANVFQLFLAFGLLIRHCLSPCRAVRFKTRQRCCISGSSTRRSSIFVGSWQCAWVWDKVFCWILVRHVSFDSTQKSSMDSLQQSLTSECPVPTSPHHGVTGVTL